MKSLLLAMTLLFSGPVFAHESAELLQRLEALEEQILELKEQSTPQCKLNYKYHTTVTNDCPTGTVVGRVFLLSPNGPIQVRCYYYQLDCHRPCDCFPPFL